jgi:ParB-like chromosome segregation protein Spo0J
MKKNDLKVTEVEISKLIAADYNPRTLSVVQFETIKDSLVKFGFVDPVIVNTFKGREMVIIGGHQRTKVAEFLKYKTVPCVFLKLNLKDEKELNVRLNRNAGEWDWDALANNFDLEELKDWGFEEYEFHYSDGDDKPKEPPVKKLKECPECGHKF